MEYQQWIAIADKYKRMEDALEEVLDSGLLADSPAADTVIKALNS